MGRTKNKTGIQRCERDIVRAPRSPVRAGAVAGALAFLAAAACLGCAPSGQADRTDLAVDRPDIGKSGGGSGSGRGGIGGEGSGQGGAPGGSGGGEAGNAGNGGAGDGSDVGPPVMPGPPADAMVPAEPVDLAPPPLDLPPPPPDVSRARSGHWRLDEGAGNVAIDSSEVGNHGGTIGILPADWQGGKRGRALLFTPARRTFIQIPDHSSTNPDSAFSLALWARPAAWTGSPRLVQKGGTDQQYSLRVEEGQLRLAVTLVGGMVVRVSAPAPGTGKWSHLCGTYDGNQLRLYIDGAVVGTAAAQGRLAQTEQNVSVGGLPPEAPETDFYAGLIDDVLLYLRALSPDEIKTLVAAKSP